MKRTNLFAMFALAAAPAFAVEIANFTAPDAWSRGAANTTYYGWDVFEGGPSLLADSTPDINPFGVRGVSMVQNNDTFANVRASLNLYSGFADSFDLTTDIKTAGGAGGFTTILVQLSGSVFGLGQTPAGFNANSFSINGQTPGTVVSGYIADNSNFWWLEWNLPGNQPVYQLEIDSEETSGSLAKITIDTAWNATTSLANAGVTVVPEPGSLTLLGFACTFLAARRRHG